MSMKMSQILKFVYFTKAQKSRYFENNTLFFLQIKIHYLHIKGYFLAKNTFVAEVTLSVKPKAAYKVSKYSVFRHFSRSAKGTKIFRIIQKLGNTKL